MAGFRPGPPGALGVPPHTSAEPAGRQTKPANRSVGRKRHTKPRRSVGVPDCSPASGDYRNRLTFAPALHAAGLRAFQGESAAEQPGASGDALSSRREDLEKAALKF